MSKAADHLRLAQRNTDAMLCLRKAGDYPEWVAVTAFYAGVQVVESVLVGLDGFSSNGHNHRSQRLKDQRRYEQLWKQLRPLREQSELARYMATDGQTVTSFPDYMPLDLVVKNLVRYRLVNLTKSAKKLLKGKFKTRFDDSLETIIAQAGTA